MRLTRDLEIWQHLTDHKAEIVSLYETGATLKEIAGKFGTSRPTLTKFLRSNGVHLRIGNLNPKFPLDENLVKDLYGSGFNTVEISRLFGVSDTTIRNRMREWGIQRRNKYSQNGVGPEHPGWRGWNKPCTGGYTKTWITEDDEMASMRHEDGRVPEHRLVVARNLGRPLVQSESVHHINGDRLDNRLANLQLRNRYHGNGIAQRCGDCGSVNILCEEILDSGN